MQQKRHAKASSAGSNLDQGSRPGSIRRAFATRGASSDSEGSGAFTQGAAMPVPPASRLFALGVVALFVLLAFASTASASQVHVASFFGNPTNSTSSGIGGMFNAPRGAAINQDGIGGAGVGDLYVVDSAKNRIQQFTAAGSFIRAWGRDVVTTGKPNNVSTTAFEVCDTTTGNVAADCKNGTTGTLGGQMNAPQGVAVNQSTGHVYITDGKSNLRVQEFTATGQFVRAWGQDVVLAGGSGETNILVNEQQRVTATTAFGVPPTGGTFTVTFEGQTTTPPIAYNASAAAVDSALEALSSIGPGNVSVSGPAAGPWTVEFTGTLGLINVAQMSANGSGLVDPFGIGGEAFVTTVQNGGPFGGFEICVNAAECKAGFSGLIGGSFGSNFSGVSGSLAIVPPGASNAGNVLVADPGNRRVQEFTAEGAFVRTFGWDVAASGSDSTGSGFEVCTAAGSGGDNCTAGVSGNLAGLPAGRFIDNSPKYVAADASGAIYVGEGESTGFSRRVDKFTPQGGAPGLSPSLFADAIVGESGGHGFPTYAIAVNPDNGRVFVLKAYEKDTICPNGSESVIQEQRLFEFSSSGDLLSTSLTCVGFAGGRPISGLAYNSDLNRFYAPANFADGGGEAHRVYTLDEDGAGPAVANLNPPSNVESHSAMLSGSITPGGPTGFPTSYRFEISKNGITWTPLSSFVNVGEGLAPVAVQATATDLEANTLYRVRVATRKAFNNPLGTSAELTFLTDSPAPEVETLSPQRYGAGSADLAGRVNPNNLPTTYHFQWGTDTSYGNTAPISDGNLSGGATEQVVAHVEGLQPDITYHYRIAATNAEGTSFGVDKSFTTRNETPAVGKRAFEMVTPPFKVTRGNSQSEAAIRNNPNVGVPSLDGDTYAWGTMFFPLTDEVDAPTAADRRIISRTPAGWSWETLNTRSLIPKQPSEISPPASFTTQGSVGASGDLKTYAWRVFNGTSAELIESPGSKPNPFYTRRTGTGLDGFTPWLQNTDTELDPSGFIYFPADIGYGETQTVDHALLNDDGTAMARWGRYRALADAPGDDTLDPSDDQQLYAGAGGSSLYLQRSADPNGLPTAPKELVNACTGTSAGGDATKIPMRNDNGNGSGSDDFIDSQLCEGPRPADATGSAVVTHGSTTLSGLEVDSGTFASGQLISGRGIRGATRIVAVNEGAGTLTLSTPTDTTTASASGNRTTGSSLVTTLFPIVRKLQVGDQISGVGIPPGTTVASLNPSVLQMTMSNPATATASGSVNPISVLAPPSQAEIAATALPRVTSRRGAELGSFYVNGGRRLETTSETAMSEDGSRTFFLSPDDLANGVPASCSSATGTGTDCPPQLFVRSHDSSGEPAVRWISRSRSVIAADGAYEGAMIAGQPIAMLGSGTSFQGASRDGRYVYFKTDAPLVPTDPNGGSATAASSNSWDLYRYELPADPDADPDDGQLLRVSGGPSGSADPSVDSSTSPFGGGLRFHSDDGKRAFFVTTSPLSGADQTPPTGGVTTPGGIVGNKPDNNGVRNLYLFDDNESGAERWRFIARLPARTAGNSASTKLNDLDVCASWAAGRGTGLAFGGSGDFDRIEAEKSNCVRGTADGSHIIFSTRGQLTDDDRDAAGDIYLYDVERDELTRVTAPMGGSEPYVCSFNPQIVPPGAAYCNGDFGPTPGNPFAGGPSGTPPAHGRGWGGMRYNNIATNPDGTVSVFFESRLELAPEDHNDDGWDVYEWREGELTLISRGLPGQDTWFAGNSTDGEDVFIWTSDRIDPREIDSADFDVYDARVGGGIPYTPPPTPCDVLALQCESEATVAAPATAAATRSLQSAGNVSREGVKKPRRCGKGKVRRKSNCVKKRSTKQEDKKSKRTANRAGRASR